MPVPSRRSERSVSSSSSIAGSESGCGVSEGSRPRVGGLETRERPDECSVEQSGDDATQPAGDDRGPASVEREETDDHPEDPSDQHAEKEAGGQSSLQASFERLVRVWMFSHR